MAGKREGRVGGEENKKNKVRDEGLLAKNVFNKYEPSASLILDSRTCDAIAVAEVHGLHALGEHDLVDSTCRRREEKDIMRNEERVRPPKRIK